MELDHAPSVDVLVVGAGPTGLSLAVSLLSRGRDVAVVDNQQAGRHAPGAPVVYPGTLEALDPYGVAERLIAQGIHAQRFTFRDGDRILTRLPFDRLPTPFPYALLVSQKATEAALLERFGQLGGSVERPVTVTELDPDDTGVTVTFAGGWKMRASFVVGADGAHSTVRQEARIAFRGDPEGASYALADVHLQAGGLPDELAVYFSPGGHLVVMPLPGSIHRLMAQVAEAPEKPELSFLQQVLDARGPRSERVRIRDVVWSGRYLTHHAVASAYRSGRILLAGDAAHVSNPLGGLGMNLGIQDAVALGRGLSSVLEGGSAQVLDDYCAARGPVAERIITLTNWLNCVATVQRQLRQVRNLAVEALGPMLRKRVAWQMSLLEPMKRNRRPALPRLETS